MSSCLGCKCVRRCERKEAMPNKNSQQAGIYQRKIGGRDVYNSLSKAVRTTNTTIYGDLLCFTIILDAPTPFGWLLQVETLVFEWDVAARQLKQAVGPDRSTLTTADVSGQSLKA